MKKIFPILILLTFLAIFACRQPKDSGSQRISSQGVCMLGGGPLPDGFGMESKLKHFEYEGIMDTLAAMIDLKITYLNSWGNRDEEPGIGVTIITRKSGEETMFVGGVSDVKGEYQLFLDAGVYDFEFSYGGCNTLLVKNAELLLGGLYRGKVVLGGHGKERKIFETILKPE